MGEAAVLRVPVLHKLYIDRRGLPNHYNRAKPNNCADRQLA